MSILCGTDLSAASSGALDVAIALARLRGDREVILVHVADPELGASSSHEAALQHARQELAAQATAARARDASVPVRSELIEGAPDEALATFAETEAHELIVIAARSTNSSLLRLGTTAAQLTARAQVPVLVVRDPKPWLAFATKQRPLKLLVGVDDSATCELSMQWVHHLRALGPVELVLGAIYYPDDAAEHYGLHKKGMVDADPAIEKLLQRDLMRRCGGDEAGVTAHARRGLGRIGDHVVELAREENVDAIVVGTHQKTGLGRLGSVSSVVVNDAPQSVVCVPPQAHIPTRTVPVMRAALVATDLSGFSNRAVPYAFALTEPDAEVHVLHTVKDDADVDIAEITRTLVALAPTGAKQKLTPHVVRGDDAAKTIAQTAARLGVDVICIASHGRSGLTRAIVGSVADRLLRETRLPVLVLRPT